MSVQNNSMDFVDRNNGNNKFIFETDGTINFTKKCVEFIALLSAFI